MFQLHLSFMTLSNSYNLYQDSMLMTEDLFGYITVSNDASKISKFTSYANEVNGGSPKSLSMYTLISNAVVYCEIISK